MRNLRFGILLLAMVAGASVWAAAQGGDRDHDGDRDRDAQSRSAPYEQGLREGREDARRNRRAPRTDQWRNNRDRRDYEAGYNRGYEDATRGGAGRGGTYGGGPYGGGAYGGGYGRPNGGSGGNPGMSNARNIGYQDGLNDGAKDLRTGHSFRPTQGDNYKNADRGFNSQFGDKNQYKQLYRQGYQEGYPIGYRQSGGGRR
jgi:hypothetical protein